MKILLAIIFLAAVAAAQPKGKTDLHVLFTDTDAGMVGFYDANSIMIRGTSVHFWNYSVTKQTGEEAWVSIEVDCRRPRTRVWYSRYTDGETVKIDRKRKPWENVSDVSPSAKLAYKYCPR